MKLSNDEVLTELAINEKGIYIGTQSNTENRTNIEFINYQNPLSSICLRHMLSPVYSKQDFLSQTLKEDTELLKIDNFDAGCVEHIIDRIFMSDRFQIE